MLPTRKRSARPAVVLLVLAGACGGNSDPSPPEGQPRASFNASCTGLACTFTNLSKDPNGSTLSSSWSFGDGATSTETKPAHVYASVGNFDVTLTVTDTEGLTDTETKTVTTNPPTTVALQFTLDQEAGIQAVLTDAQTCEAHGNTFMITAPVEATLTNDACYDQIGKEITLSGPFSAGTVIDVLIQAPPLSGPANVRVEGTFPEWTIHFEDGVDSDFDDMIVTLTALPTTSP